MKILLIAALLRPNKAPMSESLPGYPILFRKMHKPEPDNVLQALIKRSHYQIETKPINVITTYTGTYLTGPLGAWMTETSLGVKKSGLNSRPEKSRRKKVVGKKCVVNSYRL